MTHLDLLCSSNSASDLAAAQRGRGTSPTHIYDLTVGAVYRVVGMVLWETMLWLLVRGDDGAPLNAPAGLFEQVGVGIPDTWRFRIGSGARLEGSDLWERPIVAIWGYDELVDDPNHLDRLFDGGYEELRAFEKRFEEE
jgi:hypothetical protein